MKRMSLNDLKTACPLPDLTKKLGFVELDRATTPAAAKPTVWSQYKNHGRWMYKNHMTGQIGEELGFLAAINKLDPFKDVAKALKLYQNIVNPPATKRRSS